MIELFWWRTNQKSHTVSVQWRSEDTVQRAKLMAYVKFVGDSYVKATYRMKWASSCPPLAVSTAWHRIVLEAIKHLFVLHDQS